MYIYTHDIYIYIYMYIIQQHDNNGNDRPFWKMHARRQQQQSSQGQPREVLATRWPENQKIQGWMWVDTLWLCQK